MSDHEKLQLEVRILYFMRNYSFRDEELVSELLKQFNTSREILLSEIQKTRSNYPNLKKSSVSNVLEAKTELLKQINTSSEILLSEIQKTHSNYPNLKKSSVSNVSDKVNLRSESKIPILSNNIQLDTQIKPMPYVMYIIVNIDLKMGKGKTAGQVGHVVGIITEEIMRNVFMSPTTETIEDYNYYTNWVKNNAYTKVVLKATEKDLLGFIENETKCRYILDAGRTQIAPGSLTVVGFFPRNDMAYKFKNYKLLG